MNKREPIHKIYVIKTKISCELAMRGKERRNITKCILTDRADVKLLGSVEVLVLCSSPGDMFCECKAAFSGKHEVSLNTDECGW